MRRKLQIIYSRKNKLTVTIYNYIVTLLGLILTPTPMVELTTQERMY